MVALIPGQHIHIVGIGGAGMSSIAHLLLQQGYFITGSDRQSNARTQELRRLGARIYRGHEPHHIKGAELLLISSAVADDNIEVLTAHTEGIPVLKRNQMIAAIMDGHHNIAVAGTHGKTTTTSMVTHILLEAGLDPSYIIGGTMGNTGLNANSGKGEYFVIEADEYDNMFHGLRPHISVVTNIEFDHPDFFRTPHEMVSSFSRFIGLLPRDGMLIACGDDLTAQIFANNRRIVNLPVMTYGIDNPRVTWRATNIQSTPDYTEFDVVASGQVLGHVELPLAGKHNILNALAALQVAHNLELDFATASQALRSFVGTGRRFEIQAVVDDVVLVDDYAHHPTAIRMTIEAARLRYPDHAIWAVWQPHTYTRTRALFDDFASAFKDADHVLITPIYAARETDSLGVDSRDFLQAMTHPSAYYVPDFATATQHLLTMVQAPAVILIMSAGDAPTIGQTYVEILQRDASSDEIYLADDSAGDPHA
jgi:UDP-N-acetylmuramate--alanine ligase